MSVKRSSRRARTLPLRRHAPVFAALGDETRLTLLTCLCERAPCSISELADGSPISRQAITKHLRVLENAGLVHGEMAGRMRLFEIDPKPFVDAKQYLDRMSKQWDHALARLKVHVERAV